MPKGGSKHYKSGKIEPIELIEAQNLNFHLANIVKYAVRANYYSTTDLNEEIEVKEAMDKIIWYAQRYKEVFKDMNAPDK